MKKLVVYIYLLSIPAVIGLFYIGWLTSLPRGAFGWENGKQVLLVSEPQWHYIAMANWAVTMLTLMVVYIIKHFRKFRAVFGHSASPKNDWKSRALIQPVVDAKLAVLAREFLDACAKEEQLTTKSATQKLFAGATEHATTQQIVQEQLAKLKEARAAVKKTKNTFWSTRSLADDFYFKVRQSVKDYTKSAKGAKAQLSTSVTTT